jgi:hypothetical protein
MKEETRKYGGLAIAGRDAGDPRDALAIYEVGKEGLPGYRVEAVAYEDISSCGKISKLESRMSILQTAKKLLVFLIEGWQRCEMVKLRPVFVTLKGS